MRAFLGTAGVWCAVIGLCGCPSPEPEPVPPPVYSLTGSWSLTGAAVEPEFTEFLLTFNEDGAVTALSYRTVSGTSVSVTDPSAIESDSTVDGENVTITARWGQYDTLTFDGSFNGETLIDGTAAYQVLVGGLIVHPPADTARLTKR